LDHKTVIDLRKGIKNEKRPEFDHVAADTLVLWKVSIPVVQSLNETLDELDLVDAGSLSPVKKLSTVFADAPEEGHLHVVVKRPIGELDISFV
jgi:hypothetical protein